MSEPTAEQWERIEDYVEDLVAAKDVQLAVDVQAVLDYVGDLQSQISVLDVLDGLTPEQVKAIPLLVEWYRYETADDIGEWRTEWDHLPRIFGAKS